MVTQPVGRRRRAMATVRPRITCRPTADILRRDTATVRRRLTGITILPLRTTGVRRRSTFFAMDAAAEERRMGTITVLLRRACRAKMERRSRRRLGRRVPRPAEVAGATAERTTKAAIMRAARSRMAAEAAAVARRLRRLTGIIPHITVAHRRGIPTMGRGLDTGAITADRLLAIMLPTATVRLRRMAIRLTIRMVATGARPLPVMRWVVMVAVAVLVLVLMPIRPSASPSAVVQKRATRRP